MINNVIIVGRLCHDPVLNTIDEGITVCNLTLAVTRPFKDMNTGEYGTDFITWASLGLYSMLIYLSSS